MRESSSTSCWVAPAACPLEPVEHQVQPPLELLAVVVARLQHVLARELRQMRERLGRHRRQDLLRDLHTKDELPDRRFDVILDIGGNTRVSRLRRALTRSGTLVIVGGETDGRILGGVQRQLGAMLISPFLRQRLGTFVCKENADDLAVLTELIEAGKVTPAIHGVLPLESAPQAIQQLTDGAVRGKLVLTLVAS